MIEAYAFLAMFALQVLVMSVLQPAWFSRYVRTKALEFPAERFTQVYPGIDHAGTRERYLARYRALNSGIVVLGLLLMAWLFSYTRRPDWDDGPVEVLVAVYFMAQAVPVLLACVYALKYNKLLTSLLEGRRTAVLQRRELFDFVSPLTVFLAVLAYFLFVAYVLYIARNPFPGFAGPLVNIVCVTLLYAVEAFAVYKSLYSKKVNPLESHAARVHTMGAGVRACIYICIAAVVHMSLNFTLVLLDLQRWEPVGLSAFFVFTALLLFQAFSAPPRRPGADGHGSSAEAAQRT